MKKIGLISDTHSYIDEEVLQHLRDCDEVWHAGDFGEEKILESFKDVNLTQGVYGNIDTSSIKSAYPLQNFFTCEKINVFIQHIGGYPGKYAPGVKDLIVKNDIKLFISGHSHILKIIYDDKLGCLHINPGAAGKHGWHKVRTIVLFTIDESNIKDCKIVEFPR